MCKSLPYVIRTTLVAKQMKRLELSSIWALLAAFDDPLPLPGSVAAMPFEGAFVREVDSVSWMGNNTKKLLKSQSGGPRCWTFLSTAAYGKQNKVPQENIPTATATKVKAGMLAGVEAALGLSKGSLQKPIYTRLQLCWNLKAFRQAYKITRENSREYNLVLMCENTFDPHQSFRRSTWTDSLDCSYQIFALLSTRASL